MKQESIENEEKTLILIPGKIYINTVSGPRLLEEYDKIDIVLGHENLIHNISYVYEENPSVVFKNEITLDTFRAIQKAPRSHLSNLVLNNVEEISAELSAASSSGKLVVVETSRAQDKRDYHKLREISKIAGIDIICGYDIHIDRKLYYQEEDKNKFMFNKPSFLKELHLEFTLGSKGTKPNFIGPIVLKNLEKRDELENQILDAYFEISKSMGIPIMLEASEYNEFDKILATLIGDIQGRGIPLQKLILLNPAFIIKTNYLHSQEKNSIVQEVSNIQTLIDIASRGISLSFDVNYYNYHSSEEVLGFVVSNLCKANLRERVILSSGVKFKIDLIRYGGEGYNKIANFVRKLKSTYLIDDDTCRQLVRTNILNMMNWWVAEKPKVVEIKKWTCPECKQLFDDSLEKFKKMGVEVCSSKCLKAYFSKNNV